MPRVQTTPMVRFALYFLRVYLLLLLTLIGIKFARGCQAAREGGRPPVPAPATPAAQPPATRPGA